jgi:hypothetical protein
MLRVTFNSLMYQRICFNFSLCSAVNDVGNSIFTPTIKSPRSVGFLLLGMPRPGKRSSHVGGVGPPCRTGTCLPSMVWMDRLHPVRASLRLIVMV